MLFRSARALPGGVALPAGFMGPVGSGRWEDRTRPRSAVGSGTLRTFPGPTQKLRLDPVGSGEPLRGLSRGTTWSDLHSRKITLAGAWEMAGRGRGRAKPDTGRTILEAVTTVPGRNNGARNHGGGR